MEGRVGLRGAAFNGESNGVFRWSQRDNAPLTFLLSSSPFGPPMDDTSNEPHIIAASTLSSDSRELHFPNGGNREDRSVILIGLRPFEEVPMTEDGAEIDYYKVLGIDPDVGRADEGNNDSRPLKTTFERRARICSCFTTMTDSTACLQTTSCSGFWIDT